MEELEGMEEGESDLARVRRMKRGEERRMERQ